MKGVLCAYGDLWRAGCHFTDSKKKTINFYLSIVFKLYNAIVTQYFVQRNRLNLNADAE